MCGGFLSPGLRHAGGEASSKGAAASDRAYPTIRFGVRKHAPASMLIGVLGDEVVVGVWQDEVLPEKQVEFFVLVH